MWVCVDAHAWDPHTVKKGNEGASMICMVNFILTFTAKKKKIKVKKLNI